MILDQKLQRMLNDSKIAQLNSERPLHQTAVHVGIKICIFPGQYIPHNMLMTKLVKTVYDTSVKDTDRVLHTWALPG